MKESKTRNPLKPQSRIVRVADTLLTIATLIMSFKAVTRFHSEGSAVIEYCIVYILLALSCLLQASDAYHRDKTNFIKNACFSAIFAAAGVAWLFLWPFSAGVIVLIESLLLVLLVNRILAAIYSRKTSGRVINILLSLLLILLAAGTLIFSKENTASFMMTHAVLISGKALSHIIHISFSKLRIGVLRKVIRKTFAAEILMGLLLLVIAFSFVFQTLEPSIVTFFDAIWYCFAVVTTIGFGDLAVVSVLSRILSIILGIYGIVVVAVITSVIVNFYNEVRNDKKADQKESEN